MQLINADCLEYLPNIPTRFQLIWCLLIFLMEQQSVNGMLLSPEPMWAQLKRIIKANGVIVLMAQTPNFSQSS